MSLSAMIRDSVFGQLLRRVTNAQFLQYPEESKDFRCPASYEETEKSKTETDLAHSADTTGTTCSLATKESPESIIPTPAEFADEKPEPIIVLPEEAYFNHRIDPTTSLQHSVSPLDLEKSATLVSSPSQRQVEHVGLNPLEQLSSFAALERAHTEADVERAVIAAAAPAPPELSLQPTKMDDGTLVVDWYTTKDPDNPQNWALSKKILVSAQICIYTTAVYMGGAIYAASEPGVSAEFHASSTVASLGLSLYIFAYGLGALLWSPLSEIPSLGRTPLYILTFGVFVIISIPTALAPNLPGLLVLRFLQGFFGSPALATSGASLGDMFSLFKLPYALSMWAAGATLGPGLAPTIAGFSVEVMGWRWSLWEILWLAGPVWLLMFMFLPETNPETLLLRRAQRLRKSTGNNLIKSKSELRGKMSVSEVTKEALYRPWQLMLLDPAIAFTAIYTALIYGIFYTFFEAFPLVYIEMYGFTLGQSGLVFQAVTVALIISVAMYWTYQYFIFEPELQRSIALGNGISPPERRLLFALPASLFLPVGLFIFAFTSRPEIHWIVPTIGVGIFGIGIFILIQCIFMYLPLGYPQYVASLFAGNDVARSSFAAATVLFAPPMFERLGVDGGVGLLGAATAVCVVGLWALWKYGAWLRARSRFAAK